MQLFQGENTQFILWCLKSLPRFCIKEGQYTLQITVFFQLPKIKQETNIGTKFCKWQIFKYRSLHIIYVSIVCNQLSVFDYLLVTKGCNWSSLKMKVAMFFALLAFVTFSYSVPAGCASGFALRAYDSMYYSFLYILKWLLYI